MANRIKGITVEIGGNTELLAQKHKLLGQAVEETKEKLSTFKTAAEQANQSATAMQKISVAGEKLKTAGDNTLSELEKKMGSETAFSASECAEALNYLAYP